MKTSNQIGFVIFLLLATAPRLHSQGYIVPNGVNYLGPFLGLPGYGITVLRDPTNGYTTGFSLNPVGRTQPTIFTNTFEYHFILDVGVRVFLVSSNAPINQQAIQSGNYTELMPQIDFVFNHNAPFYVGLYTGSDPFYPPDGIYSDPLFGWARLVNNQGVIQLLDSALVHKAGGIYAGTLNIIPEPTSIALVILGSALWVIHLRGKPRA